MTFFWIKNRISNKPIMKRTKPTANETTRFTFSTLARPYITYVGPPKIRNIYIIVRNTFPNFESTKPLSLIIVSSFSVMHYPSLHLPTVYFVSGNPSFISFPKAFIKNLKTRKPASLSASNPVVAPKRHTPSNPYSLAKARVNPVPPTILPRL